MLIKDIFTEKSVNELVGCLLVDGYAIDGVRNTFSSVQLEYMNQEIFDELCV